MVLSNKNKLLFGNGKSKGNQHGEFRQLKASKHRNTLQKERLQRHQSDNVKILTNYGL